MAFCAFSCPGKHSVYAWDEVSGRTAAQSLNGGEEIRPLRTTVPVAVGLTRGGFAIFESRSEIVRVFGLPVGFWIGVISAGISIIAVRAIMREARPLQALAGAVQSFSVDAKPVTIVPAGARETKALVAAINDMQAKIAHLIASRTLLLGAISHDLKTYLTRLRLRIEFISPPEQLEKAGRDLDDMTRLIDDALAVARGGASFERRRLIGFRGLIEAELAERRGQARKAAFLCEDGASAVLGDPVSLRRLVANLIDNALHFGTRARVTLRVAGPWLVFIVEDDGPGIALAQRNLVFEPFFQSRDIPQPGDRRLRAWPRHRETDRRRAWRHDYDRQLKSWRRDFLGSASCCPRQRRASQCVNLALLHTLRWLSRVCFLCLLASRLSL